MIDVHMEERLAGIAQLLTESNARMDPQTNPVTYDTGFLPLHPMSFHKLVTAFHANSRGPGISLDLMCGNGGWALMTAALGYPSYGIEINPVLVKEARENHHQAVSRGLIAPETPCQFAAGNIYVGPYYDEYIADATEQARSGRYSPREPGGNPYQELGIEVSEAAIIYSFCWSGGLDFLCRYLQREACEDALFVLPNFDTKTTAIALETAFHVPGPYPIRRRRRDAVQAAQLNDPA